MSRFADVAKKNRKAGEKHKTHVYRKMSEPEARRILRDLANEMMITAEETAAIDTALAHSWCYLDGPCEYDNQEIRFPDEESKAYVRMVILKDAERRIDLYERIREMKK